MHGNLPSVVKTWDPLASFPAATLHTEGEDIDAEEDNSHMRTCGAVAVQMDSIESDVLKGDVGDILRDQLPHLFALLVLFDLTWKSQHSPRSFYSRCQRNQVSFERIVDF